MSILLRAGWFPLGLGTGGRVHVLAVVGAAGPCANESEPHGDLPRRSTEGATRPFSGSESIGDPPSRPGAVSAPSKATAGYRRRRKLGCHRPSGSGRRVRGRLDPRIRARHGRPGRGPPRSADIQSLDHGAPLLAAERCWTAWHSSSGTRSSFERQSRRRHDALGRWEGREGRMRFLSSTRVLLPARARRRWQLSRRAKGAVPRAPGLLAAVLPPDGPSRTGCSRRLCISSRART